MNKIILEDKDYKNYMKMMKDNLRSPRINILELLEKVRLMKVDGYVKGKDISNQLNLSSPLLAYHMNGLKRRFPKIGLIELGLVETIKIKSKIYYRLSKFGKKILNGIGESNE